MIQNTLLYFCSDENGFAALKIWITQQNLQDDIIKHVLDLCEQIEQTKWLELDLRKQLFAEIKTKLINGFTTQYGISPLKYYLQWIKSIQPYCFQGGYGHRINYTGYHAHFPHHWCIKPEDYHKVKIPETVSFATVLSDNTIEISPIALYEKWGN